MGGVLSQYRPAYLCIRHGATEVIGHIPPETVVANRESIVSSAQANGTIPVLAALTPMSGARKRYADDARELSHAIRQLAGRSGVRRADLEAAF